MERRPTRNHSNSETIHLSAGLTIFEVVHMYGFNPACIYVTNIISTQTQTHSLTNTSSVGNKNQLCRTRNIHFEMQMTNLQMIPISGFSIQLVLYHKE